jgi:hypothetical protein
MSAYFRKLRQYLPTGLLSVLLLLTQCTPPGLATAKTNRTVHFRIVVSPEYAGNVMWRENVGNLMRVTGEFYRSLSEVVFVIDTMYTWDMKTSPSYSQVSGEVCLMKEVPKGSSDIVLYIAKQSVPSLGLTLLGYSQVRFGYLFVNQMDRLFAERQGYLYAYHTMVHELAHMFGAVHCYPDEKSPDFMNPIVSNRLVQREGKSVEYREPAFHPNNAAIVAALLDRPFSPLDSARTPWSNVDRVYHRMRLDVNPWKLSGGMLTNYEFDWFFEEDPYYFLATWASLWGKDTLALAYLDSVEVLWKAMNATCTSGSASRNAKICGRMMGSDGKNNDTRALLHAYLLLEKALVFLGAGKEMPAQSCVDSFFTCQTTVSPGERATILNNFSYYREFYSSRLRATDPLDRGDRRSGDSLGTR